MTTPIIDLDLPGIDLRRARVDVNLDEACRRLDDVQHRLPSPLSEGFGIWRSSIRRIGAVASGVSSEVGQRVGTAGDDLVAGYRTVSGQIQHVLRRAVADPATELADDAARAIDPDDQPLEEWTRAELYERATALDVEGRSTMSKSELVDALRDRT